MTEPLAGPSVVVTDGAQIGNAIGAEGARGVDEHATGPAPLASRRAWLVPLRRVPRAHRHHAHTEYQAVLLVDLSGGELARAASAARRRLTGARHRLVVLLTV